jgi:hypothetical protein
MAFERFTRTRSRIDTPKVSIWSRGQIGFNQGAVDEYNLGNFRYVVFYYDEDTHRVGIEFTNDEESEGANKIIKRKGGGVSTSAIPFLKHYKIEFGKTKQYDLKFDKENNLYVFDLKQEKG